MRNLTGWAVVFLLLVAAGSIAAVSAAPVVSPAMTTPEMTTQATQGQGGVPAAKGRLKFKSSGPVCMCAEGLSERDIEQAMTKSNPGKFAGPELATSRGEASGQEPPPNLGVAK